MEAITWNGPPIGILGVPFSKPLPLEPKSIGWWLKARADSPHCRLTGRFCKRVIISNKFGHHGIKKKKMNSTAADLSRGTGLWGLKACNPGHFPWPPSHFTTHLWPLPLSLGSVVRVCWQPLHCNATRFRCPPQNELSETMRGKCRRCEGTWRCYRRESSANEGCSLLYSLTSGNPKCTISISPIPRVLSAVCAEQAQTARAIIPRYPFFPRSKRHPEESCAESPFQEQRPKKEKALCVCARM